MIDALLGSSKAQEQGRHRSTHSTPSYDDVLIEQDDQHSILTQRPATKCVCAQGWVSMMACFALPQEYELRLRKVLQEIPRWLVAGEKRLP